MLERSIPHYSELQTMISGFVNKFYIKDTFIYDLGCSTGNTYFNLVNDVGFAFNYVGIDNSDSMIQEFKKKLVPEPQDHILELVVHDLNKLIELKSSSVIILNLTLQFLDFKQRHLLLKNCFEKLVDGGVLLLIEKIKMPSDSFESLFTDIYYDFKEKNGYSREEINNKRKSLTTVLKPCTFKENEKLLSDAGFQTIESFFRWFNFAGFIAQKELV